MKDQFILCICYKVYEVKHEEVVPLLTRWNHRASTKYDLASHFIKFDAGDPELSQFRAEVIAELPRGFWCETRIRRTYSKESAKLIPACRFTIVGTGVDGSSLHGSFYRRKKCPRCGYSERKQVLPLVLNLDRAKGKDFVTTYMDWEDIISDRARQFLERNAPGCCSYTPVKDAGSGGAGRYYSMKVNPVERLAVPPMRVLRKRRCSECKKAVTLVRGETLLKRVPRRELSQSDLAFGDAAHPHRISLMTVGLHEKLKRSGLRGWDWNPAWVTALLTKREIRDHVPPFDVMEFVVPRTPCPKWVWHDPLD
jgi:hypothetical protein